MKLKDNLKHRRKILGLTLEDVAKKVGITRQTVQKYESGVVSNIPLDRIELLAKALDTTPGYLMGWEDDESQMKLRDVLVKSPEWKERIEKWENPETVTDEHLLKLIEAYKNNPTMQKAVDTLLGIDEDK